MRLFFLFFVIPFLAACASSSSKQLVKMDRNAGIVVWSYIPGSNMIGFDTHKYWLLNDDICKRMGFVGYALESNFTNVGLYKNTDYEVCVTAAEFKAYGGKVLSGLIVFDLPQPLSQKAINYANNRIQQIDNAVQLLNSANSTLQQQNFSAPKSVQSGPAVLKSEMVSGRNKICYYDNMGSTYAITISATQLCPIRQ